MALGGVSVQRVSIPVAKDLLEASVNLATTAGLEGACEVEYRCDAKGYPLLMEINPRLAGTLENAMHSGVNFPRSVSSIISDVNRALDDDRDDMLDLAEELDDDNNRGCPLN